MKDRAYYKGLHHRMIVDFDADEGVYFVRFPELPGCMMHGDTPEEAVKLGIAVKDEWIDAACDKGWKVPEPRHAGKPTGRLTLRVPKSLHERIIERAIDEGISQNQLIVSCLSDKV